VTEADPLSPEAFDPFFVPDRTSEAVPFIGAAAMAVLISTAPVFVPLTTGNLGILVGLALFAALALYRGLQARRHRLSRMKKVAELRARLLREGEGHASG
jgi:hypothetical protein